MSQNQGPTEKRRLLAEHGLVPGPTGFDLEGTLAFVESRGWTVVATPPINPYKQGKGWRATVFAGGAGPVQGGRGHGATEAEAVAMATAGMLAKRRMDAPDR